MNKFKVAKLSQQITVKVDVLRAIIGRKNLKMN